MLRDICFNRFSEIPDRGFKLTKLFGKMRGGVHETADRMGRRLALALRHFLSSAGLLSFERFDIGPQRGKLGGNFLIFGHN